MKPRLPHEVQEIFPVEIVRLIHSFVPHLPKQETPTMSPSLQKQITKIQRSPLKGKKETYLTGFDEFVLD